MIDFFPITTVNIDSIPKFTNEIGFQIWTAERKPTCYNIQVQIFNTALATSISYEYQNKLIISSYELYLDHAIVLEGDTIAPNTDLLMNETINSKTVFDYVDDYDLVTSTIKFNSELVDSLQFELGVYQVIFKCATDDGKEFEKITQVIFKE